MLYTAVPLYGTRPKLVLGGEGCRMVYAEGLPVGIGVPAVGLGAGGRAR